MSAVASTPWPVTSPSTTASRPSSSGEEVVEVAADVDARRRLVHLPHLEPLDRRAASAAAASAASCRRTASAAGRGARCRSRAPPARRSPSPPRPSPARAGSPGGTRRCRARRPPRSAARRGRRPPSSPSRGTERGRQVLPSASAAGAEPEGSPITEEPLHAPLAERHGLGRGSRATASANGASRTCTARGTSCSRRSSGIRTTAASRSSTSTTVRASAASVSSSEQALREGARDLVERAEAPRGRALGGERRLALLAQQGRLLVQLRVLDGDSELAGERGEQRRLVLAGRDRSRRVRSEESDDVAARDERHGERRVDSGLPRHGRHVGEARVAHDVGDFEHCPSRAGPSATSSRRSATRACGTGQATTRRLLELAVARAAEVDGDAIDVEQLGDPLDGRLERVRDGELGRRLARSGRAAPACARARARAAASARPYGERARRGRRTSRAG